MKEQIKQVLILLGIIAVIVAGLAWLTNSVGQEVPAVIGGELGGTLFVIENSYDFGTVSMAKGKVNKEFLLENKSDKNVQIGEVFTSCMCTEAELKVGNKFAGPFGMQGHGGGRKANLVVKPGETLIVKAIFDPAAHGPSGVGPIERQIVVSTGAEQEPISLQFKAVVTP
ncbi:MAG: DUF1573 domain-containing protein [Candidatus Azambacteria bacterium]|nr:DUF1573 domain-containing protein [Candidatus Azambacteria bacterium]